MTSGSSSHGGASWMYQRVGGVHLCFGEGDVNFGSGRGFLEESERWSWQRVHKSWGPSWKPYHACHN